MMQEPADSVERGRRFADKAADCVAQADRMLPEGAGGDWRAKEVRRLALDLALAGCIAASPNLINDVGIRNLDRWRSQNGCRESPALAEWRDLLMRPLSEVLGMMRSVSDRATRMRRSTPFTGVLTQWERRMVYAKAGFGAYPAR